jgi:hypothetical protein
MTLFRNSIAAIDVTMNGTTSGQQRVMTSAPTAACGVSPDA